MRNRRVFFASFPPGCRAHFPACLEGEEGEGEGSGATGDRLKEAGSCDHDSANVRISILQADYCQYLYLYLGLMALPVISNLLGRRASEYVVRE